MHQHGNLKEEDFILIKKIIKESYAIILLRFQTRMTGSISLKLVSGANRLVPLRESKVGGLSQVFT